jgi:hypothetical protein
MDNLEQANKQILSKKYGCEICNYYTERKNNLNNHLLTAKHFSNTNGQVIKQKLSKKYICEFCFQEYKYSSGLCKHRKKCLYVPKKEEKEEKDEPSEKELIMLLIKENNDLKNVMINQNNDLKKENSDLKNMVIECIKNGIHNTTNNNNNTINGNNNKTFNLQFFLNEQCKDALNITDFVNSIQVQVQDLEETGKLGYVDGISKVVINNLNKLTMNNRPIHCSDIKREVLYIKDNDEWTKESENKDKIKNAIKQVANKNIKQITEWVKLHPECYDSSSKQNDKYLKIVSNAMSGSTEQEQHANLNKIISKVAKEVIIDK